MELIALVWVSFSLAWHSIFRKNRYLIIMSLKCEGFYGPWDRVDPPLETENLVSILRDISVMRYLCNER